MARMPNLTGASEPGLDHAFSWWVGSTPIKRSHVAAVIDAAETVLAIRSFATTRAGYRSLVRWLRFYLR